MLFSKRPGGVGKETQFVEIGRMRVNRIHDRALFNEELTFCQDAHHVIEPTPTQLCPIEVARYEHAIACSYTLLACAAPLRRGVCF